VPLVTDGHLTGAIEFGLFRDINDTDLEFIEQCRQTVSVGFGINHARQEKNLLLQKTLEQAEELRTQQEELQQTNEELEERAQLLEQQREQINLKKQAIEIANDLLLKKAEELEQVSTYKSEFLANMSHELRTPLNSLMILSGLLRDNRDGNLTPKQVEFAKTIHGAGNDLLNLINDILDLSKIEAGKLEYHYEETPLQGIFEALKSTFNPVAEQKGLAFELLADPSLPVTLNIDEQRIMQILKNLLSNAFKFTSKGEVRLKASMAPALDNPLATRAITFAVQDTGIGISPDKLNQIFQAFKQADGTTSRKYGGTGLGLSISLQLVRAMGGDIRVSSQEGHGSIFTLYIPVSRTGERAAPVLPAPQTVITDPARALSILPPIPDDREALQPGDKSILVIEDDHDFASILLDLLRDKGYKALYSADGENGLAVADRYQPSAIILDVMLPGMDGWLVMQSLKDNPRTRHIPVHFLTCLEERQKAMSMGAIGFITKPVDTDKLDKVFSTIEDSISKTVKKLLIVEDDRNEANSMVALLGERDVTISVASTGREAIELLEKESFDSIILDIGLSDMSGFDLLEHMRQTDTATHTPVIIHSGRDLTHEDERKLRNYAESIIIKGAKSPERLLNEVSLFLHLVEEQLHPDKQRMIRSSLDREAMLEGKKVLLVDDDMRNLFSLASILSERQMTVIEAENGIDALTRLEENPDIDIVLMDIMMPDMDGYTAIGEIRKEQRHKKLPIIAMTAKALKGDHEKCIAAGANDYISKPLDTGKLLSLLRVWLYRNE